jgi:hypothetical protein
MVNSYYISMKSILFVMLDRVNFWIHRWILYINKDVYNENE